MDPQVQGSFIPKASLQAQARGGGMGLFLLVSLLIFVMSLLAAGGSLAYTLSLLHAIASKAESLQRDEGAFDPAAIQDLLRMDSRIGQAKLLMQRHTAASALFALLGQLTLEKVQFLGMNFILNQDGSGSLSLSGVGDSFSTVALQSDQFGGSKILRDVIFSGIAVGESGRVAFTVNAVVDPQTLLYSRNLTQQTTTPTP